MGVFGFLKRLLIRKENKKKKRDSRKTKKVSHKHRIKRKRSFRRAATRKVKKASKKRASRLRKATPKRVRKKQKIFRSKEKSKTISKIISTSPRAQKEREIGTITHYFGKISVGIIKLSGPLAVGSTIRVKGINDDFTQAVSSMQHNHQDITYAERGLEIGIKVVKPVHENDKVYLV